MATARSTVSQYANLQRLPAVIGAIYVVCSLYALGGMSDFTINWFIDYTISAEHASIASLLVYGVAFMSSETKSFEYYEDWEKGLILAAPISIAAWQWVDQVQSWMLGLGDPLGAQLVFVIGVVGWVVAER